MKIVYHVNTGVNFSHISMNIKEFEKLKDAREYFDERKNSKEYSAQCGEIKRLEFPNIHSSCFTKQIDFYDNSNI